VTIGKCTETLRTALEALHNVPPVGDVYDQQHSDQQLRAILAIQDFLDLLSGETSLDDRVKELNRKVFQVSQAVRRFNGLIRRVKRGEQIIIERRDGFRVLLCPVGYDGEQKPRADYDSSLPKK
jgi:hypothetical protein